ncbi:MAG: acyl-CoA synthetase [Thalassovita sp.]
MPFETFQATLDLEAEQRWEDRDVPVTMYQFLTRAKEKYGSSDAISFQLLSGAKDKAETLTWSELHGRTCQAANMFRDLGIGETDVVACILPNCNETIQTILGGAIAGIVNPINPLLEPEQIAAILRETGAKVVVTLKSFPKSDVAQKTAEAVRHAQSVHTVLEIDLNRYLTPPKSWIVPLLRPKAESGPHHADVLDFAKTVKKYPRSLDFADSTEDRVGAYFHTGGTTGMPKVAQHKYSGMVYNGWLGENLLFNPEDNVMCPLPMFHVFACHVIMMSMISSGAHVVFPTPAGYRGEGVFDNFWKLIERWKISFIITVPTAVSAMMQRPVDADISSVKTAFSGSAPMPQELFTRFQDVSGVGIIEGYGLTEATCLVSCNPLSKKKIGTIGVRFPYSDVRIFKQVDGEVVECAADEIGEICVSNPGVWPGNTYTEAAKNEDLYHHGKYLRTGDLGHIDAENYITITGRAKDLIIRGGHNIDPAEIEEALLTHQDVAMTGAIGQPDAHSGELPCVYVELVAGATATAEELAAHCKVHIHQRAAIPKHVEILDELPKTAVGKVFKPDLRKRAITRVYNQALDEAKLNAKVVEVVDDKKRGLVAKVERTGVVHDDEVGHVLGAYTRPWDWSE